MNRREYKEFVNSNFEKSEMLIVVGMAFIAIFEVIFGLFNVFKVNRNLSDNLYLACYLVLLFVTVLAILFCTAFRKNKYFESILPWFIHIYDALIFIWAIYISVLDIWNFSVDGIPSPVSIYPIVFITVMFSLPFFLRIHYALNVSIELTGIVAVTITAYFKTGKFPIGYNSNLIVSGIMGTLTSILGYRVALKNYRLEKTLLESSTKDSLTKLFNRGALDDRLEEVSAGRDLYNVVMLDCDDFKKINDQHGHRVGDKALVAIAELIQREFGKDCYRYGGDEFVIITTFTANTIKDSLKQINAELKENFTGAKISVTAGIYQLENGSTVGKIIRCVDSALYEAKNTKKGTVAVYKKY